MGWWKKLTKFKGCAIAGWGSVFGFFGNLSVIATGREDSSENTETRLAHLELRNWIFELILLLCNFAQWSPKYPPTSLYFLVFQKWSKVSCIGPPNSLPLTNGELGLSDVFNLHISIIVHALHYQSCPYCQQENLQQL